MTRVGTPIFYVPAPILSCIRAAYGRQQTQKSAIYRLKYLNLGNLNTHFPRIFSLPSATKIGECCHHLIPFIGADSIHFAGAVVANLDPRIADSAKKRQIPVVARHAVDCGSGFW